MSLRAREALAGGPARSLELVRGAAAEGLTTPGALLGDGSREHSGRALRQCERLTVEDGLSRDRHRVEEGLHHEATALGVPDDPGYQRRIGGRVDLERGLGAQHRA